jgi:hypothetical protein
MGGCRLQGRSERGAEEKTRLPTVVGNVNPVIQLDFYNFTHSAIRILVGLRKTTKI